MRRLRGAGVLLSVLLVVLLPGVAESAGTISGTVTQLGGSPIAGALVTVAATDQPPVTTTTTAGGTFAVNVGGSGPYSLSVLATGFAGYSVRGLQPGPLSDPIQLAASTFTPLPVYGGDTFTMGADATSGIFYTAMNLAPELYRTLDHGGTWQPVTMRYEDADTGLPRGPGVDPLTVSSVSGELATRGQGGGAVTSFSTDYGLTWRTVGGESVSPAPVTNFLYWGHASPTAADNVLMAAIRAADGTWTLLRANMSLPEPVFVKEPGDPFGQGSVIAAADSATGSFVGRVSATGELSFARLTPPGNPLVWATENLGFPLPTPPGVLHLGGATEAAAPPDGALVVGGSGPSPVMQMLTKNAGAASFAGGSFSSQTPVPAGCQSLGGEFSSPKGSVAPTSTGIVGFGNVGICWVKKNDTALTSFASCCAPGTGEVAYDSSWGAGNLVILRAGGNGPVKSARLDPNGVPNFPQGTASGGTGDGSGGLSIAGMVSLGVFDIAYGPAGGQDLAVAARVGAVTLARKNGGPFTEVVNRGWSSTAAQWWQGASGEWLAFSGFGHGGGKGMTAALGWNGGALGMPNVNGSRCADLGAPGVDCTLTSFQAVPGTDTVFIGLGKAFDQVFNDNRLVRARLVNGNPPSLTDVFPFDSIPGTLRHPQAMAYCPQSSSAPQLRDVLFVATGEFGGNVGEANTFGSLLRISGATTAQPTATVVSSIPQEAAHTYLLDVRASCSATAEHPQGIVYAGGNPGFFKSTDGGVSFARITVPGPGGTPLGNHTPAIGLNPVDGKDVTVTGGPYGTLLNSKDAGLTWTLLNDPATERPVEVHDIEVLPGGELIRAQAADIRETAVLGTGSGALRADVSVSGGIFGVSGPGFRGALSTQISDLATDGEPAVAAAHATGQPFAVFRRPNGLAYASTAADSWSVPLPVRGTSSGDTTPAITRDSLGRLHVAFSRTRRPAPGIYSMTRGRTGVWSVPRRVSTGAGDRLPAIVASGRNAVDVAFLRTRGSRGVYHVSLRRGRWGAARKVRGTRVADASQAHGGPSLATRSGRLHLVFARARGKAGIYYTLRRGTRWSALKRLTRRRDAQPSLVITAAGVKHVAFRRQEGRRRGLFALRGARRWSLTRIPRTIRADTEPALASIGGNVILAFARPTGARPGVYFSERISGAWSSPTRGSAGAKDRKPSVGSHRGGRLTIVFERG